MPIMKRGDDHYYAAGKSEPLELADLNPEKGGNESEAASTGSRRGSGSSSRSRGTLRPELGSKSGEARPPHSGHGGNIGYLPKGWWPALEDRC